MAAKAHGTTMAGFVVFAGTMLMVIALINIFEGLLAIFSDEELVLTRNNLIVVDVTGWGWTLVISGLILFAVGAGLLLMQTWARIVGIVVVGLHLVSQIAWLGAYPVWSLLMIALDVAVLFALTVKWSDVRGRIGGDRGTTADRERARVAAAEQRMPPLV
ncbi:DUF7144 family membrane protein [Kribbella jiaozuonensis]|uniref:DUF7144 domain-containing protein n=1 Tax=Kribbella jiaozuonensis TaxID=2575441 RepID=A0A4U3LVI3_9ACTN|nr:hypothetical protein [Kribbella jiaozuonensis]TKK80168.1 hypothetical protein FDA38_17710 [Kribbella jiaozuonensis]